MDPPVLPNPADEIARLTAALETMQARAAQTEAALEEQRVFLEKAQQVAHIGSWIADLYGSDRLTLSTEMYQIAGAPDGDQITRTQSINFVHPDDRQAVRAACEAALANGQPFEIDHRVVRGDGTVRWVQTRGDVVRNARGQPTRMVGTMQDVTSHRELEEQLRQSQKLEALGQLAGGISHDLNNALTAIIGFAELVASQINETDPVHRDVLEIRRAAERAESVTRQLLAFSRKQRLEPRVFHPAETLSRTAGLLTRVIGRAIDLTTIVAPDLPAIYGDPRQIEQAIVNLAVNARDAMAQGGTLTIRATAVDLDESFLRAHQPMDAGRFVQLSVIDSGHGMTPAVRARMFEPFFTTKETGRGTGLGLAMVYGTVKQSGGFVTVDTATSKGTSVHLYFPAAAPRTAARQPAVDRDSAVGSATILVVEDEPGVRSLAVAALARDGFRVLQADSGKTALAVAAQADHIDVLLTDVTMPEMSGIELAAALAKSHHGLRIIVMSGHRENETRLPELQPRAEFLPKPFTVTELRRRVRAALEAISDQLE